MTQQQHPDIESLQQENEALDAFVRDLVHEVMTPLGQLAGVADLLLREGACAAGSAREWLELQAAIAKGMIDAVHGLLDLARHGSAVAGLTRIDVSQLCHELADELNRTQVGHARLRWRIQDGINVVGISPQIRLVMRNLLLNAAKYTRDAECPEVSVSATSDGVRQCLEISDNGPGFPNGSAERLFVPFSRLAHHAHIEGTGLGLSLAKRIVERHGGSITADCGTTGGARVRISLPERSGLAAGL
jgi:signal transduction histidine kinase